MTALHNIGIALVIVSIAMMVLCAIRIWSAVFLTVWLVMGIALIAWSAGVWPQ